MQVEKESKRAGLEKEDALIEGDGEWELEILLLEWGKSGHPRFNTGINSDQNWID